MGVITESNGIFRQIRRTLGLTQVQVADILGITQSAVSKIEQNPEALAEAVRLVKAKKLKLNLVIELGDHTHTFDLTDL
jgi:predicted transcriptional regulator